MSSRGSSWTGPGQISRTTCIVHFHSIVLIVRPAPFLHLTPLSVSGQPQCRTLHGLGRRMLFGTATLIPNTQAILVGVGGWGNNDTGLVGFSRTEKKEKKKKVRTSARRKGSIVVAPSAFLPDQVSLRSTPDDCADGDQPDRNAAEDMIIQSEGREGRQPDPGCPSGAEGPSVHDRSCKGTA